MYWSYDGVQMLFLGVLPEILFNQSLSSFSGQGAIARNLSQTHAFLKYDGLIISK